LLVAKRLGSLGCSVLARRTGRPTKPAQRSSTCRPAVRVQHFLRP
jgi:hypothetical protein